MIERVKLSAIKNNKNNPRVIKDYRYKQLQRSLLEFPEMLELRPVVLDGSNTIIGGQMRKKAYTELIMLSDVDFQSTLCGLTKKGHPNYNPKVTDERLNKLITIWSDLRNSKTVPITRADDLTDEQKVEFNIKDNAHFGEWDYDNLANIFSEEPLDDWGVEGFPFDSLDDNEESEDEDDNEAWMQNIQRANDSGIQRSNTINRSEFDPEYQHVNNLISDGMEYLTIRVSSMTSKRWKELKKTMNDKSDDDIMTELLNAR